jgi:hypothetical protein
MNTETKTAKVKEYAPADKLAAAVALYNEKGNSAIDQIAKDLDKTRKSVISKFVNMKVYVADPKPEPKAKDDGPTKKELLATLSAKTKKDFHESLSGATKAAISDLINLFDNRG